MHTLTNHFIPIHIYNNTQQIVLLLNMVLQICKSQTESHLSDLTPRYIEKLHDLLCVIIGMYGYEMVCTSMHEYLLAPSMV